MNNTYKQILKMAKKSNKIKIKYLKDTKEETEDEIEKNIIDKEIRQTKIIIKLINKELKN